jgi:hypothetical protein
LTADELHERRRQLEDELREVNRQITYLDCAGMGRCHGCMVWCDSCGDVGAMCDAIFCDRHRCNETGCRGSVEDSDHIIEGQGYCPEHVEANR